MRIEQLEYLLDIEKTNSITKTAENFFISRQVVSSNIRSLENFLGVQILDRNQNNIFFTPTGKIVLEKIKPIVASYYSLLEAVSEHAFSDNQKDLASLEIYSIARLNSTILPEIVPQFRNINPNTILHIKINASKEILETLQHSKQKAIGFISYPDYNNNLYQPFQPVRYPDLTIYPFIKSQFFLCFTKNSRYNTKSTFEQSDLETLPLISYTPAYESLSPNSSPELNITSYVNDLNTFYTFIKNDLGAGLITLREYTTFNDTKNLILKPILSNKTLYYAYVTKAIHLQDKAIAQFIELAKNYKL